MSDNICDPAPLIKMTSPTDDPTRSALLRASKPPSKELFTSLVTANHILHYHNVLDAFGHVSVRNPQNPSTFFVSRSLAPALVSARTDLEEYNISDASPLNKDAPKGYAERFIHSEIYKKYPSVNSVVHSHAEAVLPYSISNVPLRPVYHMAGVMSPAGQCPIYDISLHYKGSDDLHSLLVTNSHLGEGLANGFAPSTSTVVSKATNLVKNFITSPSQQSSTIEFPTHPTVLMRGHGFTCVGAVIEEAVYRAVFTCSNARIQTTTLLLQNTFNTGLVADRFGHKEEQPGQAGPAKQEPIKFLSDRESRDAWTANQGHAERPWKLWCAEVRAASLYKNEVGDPPGSS